MQDIVFIGDEVTATAFRLAGIDILLAEDQNVARIVTDALGQWRMILTTTEIGRSLPVALYERLLKSQEPLVVFLPDLAGRVDALDLEARVRRELGIDVGK
ncbi:V-type ATP synthase subunit F [Marimonas lutisalis]|uniref:V-type ATP synthase subunit F n=1 Tax=Marimonas lutisalis TaxID=2545756 RepID=UPI0010F894AF|nr:V-type ATP synthase subunit F [Marimonas lutisalis]